MFDLKKAKEFYDFASSEKRKYLEKTQEACDFLKNAENEIENMFAAEEAQRALKTAVAAHCSAEVLDRVTLETFVDFSDMVLNVCCKILFPNDEYFWASSRLIIPLSDIEGLLESGLTKENLEKYYQQ
jgi:hypothetical protein